MREKTDSFQYHYGVLRIMACILVIVHHFIGAIHHGVPNVTDQKVLLAIDNLCMVNNGLFFMMSGKFALERWKGTIREYYKSRVIKIIVPFLLIYFLKYFVRLKGSIPKDFLREFFRQLLQGDLADWFVYAVIGFYLAAPFFYKMFAAMSEKEKLLMLGLLLFCISLRSVNKCFRPVVFMEENPFLENLSFFLLGYLLDHIERLRKYRWHILFAGLVSGVISTVEITWFPSFNPSLYGVCLSRVILCAAVFVLIGWRSSELAAVPKKIVRVTSGHTYYIYLFHDLAQDIVISAIAVWVFRVNIYIFVGIGSLGTFFLSYGMAAVYAAIFTKKRKKNKE